LIKKMLLVFLCLSLFLSIPGCKKELPTQPDLQPILVLPTIAYFTATPGAIMLGESSTLSWSVTNATRIWIDRGVGDVAATGTVEVSPTSTIVYTLSATTSDGSQTRTAQVLIYRWAVLEISTIPENITPIFYWDPFYNVTTGDFTVVITETGGVGGQIDSIWIDGKPDPFTTCTRIAVEGGTFSANGTIIRSVSVFFLCRASTLVIIIKGVDMNGYTIDLEAWYGLTPMAGVANTATMTLLKIVEGQNHHKLIK